jgi:hypothetical protein
MRFGVRVEACGIMEKDYRGVSVSLLRPNTVTLSIETPGGTSLVANFSASASRVLALTLKEAATELEREEAE